MPSISAVFIVGLLFSVILIRQRYKRMKLPPGPPGLPLIGNVFDMPTAGFDWLTFGKWCEQYGPVTSVTTPKGTVVIVSTHKMAMDLLAKRAPQYSGRPWIGIVALTGWKNSFAFVQYGYRHREYRKIFHSQLGNPMQLSHFHPSMEEAAMKFVTRCLSNLSALESHTRLFAASNVLKLTYGYETQDENDDLVKIVETSVEYANKWTVPSAHVVLNMFPAVQYLPEGLPGTGFWKVIREARGRYDAMIDVPFNWSKKQLDEGNDVDSLVTTILGQDRTPEEYEIAKHVAGSLFAGGTETTSSAILFMYYALLKYPVAQKQLQEEMDEVIGRDNRPPNFNDRASLPLLEAFVKEVLRFYPIAPIGIPHTSEKDDTYDDYIIPKNSVIIALTAKISRDPSVYSSPDTFNPSRFLGPNPEQDPYDYVFGYGRRICPGRFFADLGIWIAVATTIRYLDLRPADVNGKREVPELKQTPGITSHPEPFPLEISQRQDFN